MKVTTQCRGQTSKPLKDITIGVSNAYYCVVFYTFTESFLFTLIIVQTCWTTVVTGQTIPLMYSHIVKYMVIIHYDYLSSL